MKDQRLKWLDRDIFMVSDKLVIYNYNTFMSIGCYKEVDKITGDTFLKISGKTTHGVTIVFVKEDYSKNMEIREIFNNFISSRPASSNKTVKSINIC